MLKEFDYILVFSGKQRASLLRKGVDREKIRTIPIQDIKKYREVKYIAEPFDEDIPEFDWIASKVKGKVGIMLPVRPNELLAGILVKYFTLAIDNLHIINLGEGEKSPSKE